MDEGDERLLLGQRVLVIEDDALVGMGLVASLQDLGGEVAWSSTIDTAITNINRLDPISLAVVDLNLNGIHSAPILDALINRQVLTILCTGYDTSFIDQRYAHLPCVAKPFTRAKMIDALRKHIVK